MDSRFDGVVIGITININSKLWGTLKLFDFDARLQKRTKIRKNVLSDKYVFSVHE